MNYKDYFKREAVLAKLKDAPKGEFDNKELEMGKAHEKEHTNDEKAAEVIAKQHLAEDPHYYSRLKKAGIDECGFDDVESGLPKVGGALAIPHLGQPIHMSKIIQVGPALGQGPATGVLGGMTACEKKGVNVDKGGVAATADGDKETITAGGKEADPNVATKSVGGPVVPNKGEKQGGPNTKGTYANTAKLQDGGDNKQTPVSALSLQESHKRAIRKITKEVLKEITFNRKTGKWEKISEGSQTEYERNFGKSQGGVEPNVYEEEMDMKMGPGYKGPAARQYRTVDDDQARQVQYEPEITEMYDEEEEAMVNEQYFKLLTKRSMLTESETTKLNLLKERLQLISEKKEKWLKGAVKKSHKGYCTPMTKSTCTPRRKAFAMRAKHGGFEEAASYKNVSPNELDTAKEDKARSIQVDPNVTEGEMDYNPKDPGDVVYGKIEKLFQAGKPIVEYDDIITIAQQLIKDPDTAMEVALNVSTDLAERYHYTDDELRDRFVKNQSGVAEGGDLENLHQAMKDIEDMPQKKWGQHLHSAGSQDLEKIHQDINSQKPKWQQDAEEREKQPEEPDTDDNVDENTEMKMGPSHKVVQPRQYKVSDDNFARTNQYDPQMTEAGGMATQEKSFRTANDMPQIPKNRHDGTIDETEKKSNVKKAIQKGTKVKKAAPQQKLTHKGSKTTKSGVHKKKNV